MKKKTRSLLLTESSTSDGATLWLVLEKLSDQAQLDDILVEIQNEEHLVNMILGADPKAARSQYRLFVSEQAAMKFAQQRLGQPNASGTTNDEFIDPNGAGPDRYTDSM